MKRLAFILVLLFFSFTSSCSSSPELAFKLPNGANSEANKHNEEGISHYNQGHYNEALKHFHMASEVDSRIGESHYNEAISLDALGRHGEATDHFFVARKYASGNLAILQSQILNAHAPMDREGS